ncbi:MAG TPA: hypothetical protein PKM43_01655 [Verrucomicrobiota bacterium]|nr:hypothetical protein [Verrucomicrobiota bacterium]HRZ35500.1 hypothetical protein [Candidatus Paceibacterota bacterium]HRZ54349.1 hypothetical protein [Candidatus Paceibacterota bacterium]
MISASAGGSCAVSLVLTGLFVVPLFGGDTEMVGRRGENRTVLPLNQDVTPLGRQTDLAGANAWAHAARSVIFVPDCGPFAVELTSRPMSGRIA